MPKPYEYRSFPMYYKKPKDKELMREGDPSSIDSADPLTNPLGNEPNLSTEPTGSAGKIAKLRKKGMPYARK